MTGRASTCRRYELALVAHVYGEPHRDHARLVDHLRACAACRREAADLRALRGAIEALPALVPRSGVNSRAGRGPWFTPPRLVRALPAGAVVLIACLAFVGKVDLVSSRGPPAAETIFGASALVSCRTFDGSELDRRLDWVAGAIAGLGGDPW